MGATGTSTLSAELWSRIDGVYAAILDHPFLAGLTDGSLERETFRFYVIQDAHYLREYARALSVCAAKAPAESEIAMFNKHAAGAIDVERSLHESSGGERRRALGDAALPQQPRLYELPAVGRLRRLVRRGARGGAALLLDL